MYRIVTQVSRYVSHRDFRYRATPSDDDNDDDSDDDDHSHDDHGDDNDGNDNLVVIFLSRTSTVLQYQIVTLHETLVQSTESRQFTILCHYNITMLL